MRRLCVVGTAAILLATPASGDNSDGSLAIHLVASDAYLECEDLCPPGMTCEDINCDLTMTELEASGGYGYAAFVAYNTDEVVSLEFYVVGWPTGSRAPSFWGPEYCPPETHLIGEPFEAIGGSGGFLSFTDCRAPCTKLFCFSTISFGPQVLSWLPITIEYAPSSFSYPSDPQNVFIGCSPLWVVTTVSYEHPAVIGGECDPIPNCEPGPTATERSTWGAVKNLYR
jgi:hypothetical protein